MNHSTVDTINKICEISDGNDYIHRNLCNLVMNDQSPKGNVSASIINWLYNAQIKGDELNAILSRMWANCDGDDKRLFEWLRLLWRNNSLTTDYNSVLSLLMNVSKPRPVTYERYCKLSDNLLEVL